MSKPILVVMAAGMGSRFKGLKQIAAADDYGGRIIDYSLFDARRAGFERVVFIIKEEIEEAFKEAVGNRIAPFMEVRYAYQRLSNLPKGYSVPEGREKPWGTAHAVMSAAPLVDAPFCVINADDFYGADAFKQIYNYLSEGKGSAMVGYKLKNTLTENGYVSRGECVVSDGFLTGVTERVHIEAVEGGGLVREGEEELFLPGDTVVSMNFWGFEQRVMDAFAEGFGPFLSENLAVNPLKCEYFLPFVVNTMLKQGERVRVLTTDEKWYGVTYKEDMPGVRGALNKMREDGKYPSVLWEDAHV